MSRRKYELPASGTVFIPRTPGLIDQPSAIRCHARRKGMRVSVHVKPDGFLVAVAADSVPSRDHNRAEAVARWWFFRAPDHSDIDALIDRIEKALAETRSEAERGE